MVSPIKALIDFHHRFCPDVPIDSPIVVYEFLEKLYRYARERAISHSSVLRILINENCREESV